MTAESARRSVRTPSDRELVLTWVFDAPRDLVFTAHTSCEHLSRWWGSHGSEMAECEIDFRVGGKWRMALRGADGVTNLFFGEFVDIVPPETIVWTFHVEGQGDRSVQTLRLTEEAGQTLLTTTSVFDSAHARDVAIDAGMAEGAAQTWERLAEYLQLLAEEPSPT
jgi:uncharacterized protein YndB with AHSA1/START domain